MRRIGIQSVASPAGRLVAFWLFCLAEGAAYAHYGVEPSTLFELSRTWGLSLLLVWWVEADARETGYRPCFEYNAFMFFGWPVLLPHYLLRTRGRHGFLLIFYFLALLFGPAAIAAAAYYLLA